MYMYFVSQSKHIYYLSQTYGKHVCTNILNITIKNHITATLIALYNVNHDMYIYICTLVPNLIEVVISSSFSVNCKWPEPKVCIYM